MEWQEQLIETAVDLVRKGYAVFPCIPGTKRPATKNGLKDASRDPGEIRAWWDDNPAYNIGLNCGGLLVVDFDDPQHPWLTDCPDFVSGAIARTPRGGTHVYFRQPEGMRLGNTSGRLGRQGGVKSKIDTRGCGGYVLAWPSAINPAEYKDLPAEIPRDRPLFYSGELQPVETLPTVPTWLLAELAEPARATPAAGTTTHRPAGPDVEQRARAYLAAMAPAIAGSGGHGATFAAAVALVHGFDLGAARSLSILESDYNPRCEPAWSFKELAHKIDSAVNTPHDRPRGHLRDAESSFTRDIDGVDLSGLFATPLAANADRDDAPPAPASKKIIRRFPDHLLHVPGFIAAVTAYANETAYKKQPVLALGAALSLLSVLTGRKVCDIYGTRTNLYSVGVCDSGGGKERPRQVNKDILTAASLEAMIGPEGIGSASGLIAAVDAQPAILFQLDEIGRILKAMGDGKNSPHLAHIPTNLIKLWTSANSTFKSDAVVDTKRVKTIVQPHAVLWGTTVQKSFYESFNADSLTDGFLSRMMVFESNDPNPVPQSGESQPVPQELVEGAVFWRDHPGAGGNMQTTHPRPACVPYDPAAAEVMRTAELDARDRRTDDDATILWTRLVEKARKLALLYACSECPTDPRVTVEAAEWAVAIASETTLKMLDIAEEWASSSRYEARAKQIMRIISKAGPKGIQRAILCKAFRESAKDREELLQNLRESGQIDWLDTPTSGRPLRVYYATQEAEAA